MFYVLSACSLVMGLQDTVRVPYRFRKVHVRVPWGPLWHGDIRTFRFAGTIRSHVDAVRAWKNPYDQWCRALRGLVRPASAGSDSIYQAKHDYVTFDSLGPGRLQTGLLWAQNHG